MSPLHMVIAALFLMPLLVAALWDLATFRIPNPLPLSMVALFPLGLALAAVPVAWGWHVVAFLLVLAVASALFALGLLGGGDVKLLAAASLWLGAKNLAGFLVLVSVGGALLTVAILVLRLGPIRRAIAGLGLKGGLLNPGAGIPYGVAIALGGVLLVRQLPMIVG